MKPEQNTIVVDDTTQGNNVAMGIHEESFAHVMDMLTGIYEDPELAPGRELATNAIDSHVASGQTRPIEVTVGRRGSQLSLPVLKIQDWGLGMDESDIEQMYSQYGASSKRGNNAEAGMFGIGAKSPLAYADMFTLVCVKDGNKIVVSIARDEEGGGTMTVMDKGAVEEPNGVLAEVPVQNGNGMETKLEHFFAFWPRGKVLLNGEEPRPYIEHDDAVKITDSITVVPTDSLHLPMQTDYVVMGNVPYPCNLSLYARATYGERNKSVIAEVGIGGLSIPPARESLKDTKRTKDTLANIRREFEKAAQRIVQEAVDGAANHGDALQAFVKTSEALPPASRPPATALKYDGDSLPEWDEVFGSRTLSGAGFKYSTGRYKPELATVARGIWITEFENTNFTGSQREKLKLYLEKEGMSDPLSRPLYLVPDDWIQHDKWIPQSQRFDWPTIRKWTVPGGTVVAGYGTKVITGSYWAHLSTSHPDYQRYDRVVELAGKSMPKKSLYWVQAGKHGGKGWHSRILKHDPEATLVVLPINRVDKFNRDMPHAVEVKEAIRTKIEAKVAGTAKDTLLALRMDSYYAQSLEEIKPLLAKIPDPALKRALKLAILRCDLDTEISEIEDESRTWGVKLPENDDPAIATVQKRYPLLENLDAGYSYRRAASTLPMDDILIYIKAAYAERKEAS